MKNELTVSVVIPNFNGEELLERNLPQVLMARDNVENNIIEIIVVDDFSDDGSVTLVQNKFPTVKLVRHKLNRGFPASVNTGVRTSKGELVVLLNTDVSPSANFLVSISNRFKDKKIFAVSLHESGYGWAKGIFKDGFIVHESAPETGSLSQTFWVSGGSGIFRRSLWISLGGMDEALFTPFYWEDLDISYRAAKRGYRLLWDPRAKVVHEHESTIGKLSPDYASRIQERNQLLFIWKNLTSPNLFRRHIIGLIKRVLAHPGYIKVVFAALTKLGNVLKARSIEKKETKISDEVIFARFK